MSQLYIATARLYFLFLRWCISSILLLSLYGGGMLSYLLSPTSLGAQAKANSPLSNESNELSVSAKRASKGLGRSAQRIPLHDAANKTATKISEVVEKQAGTKVTRYGAPGTFSSLSIRGANPNQTGVYWDGLLLNDVTTSGVNLENLPLELFQELDFYRSHTPLSLPGINLGGAIDLLPRQLAPGKSLFFLNSYANSLPGGALGMGYLSQSMLHYVHGEGSQNKYNYNDDNGTTLFNKSDDRIRKRENEDYYSYGYSGLFNGGTKNHKFKFLLDLFDKQRGLPGPVGSPLKEVRLREERALFKAAYQVGLGDFLLLDTSVGAHLGRSKVIDPKEELSYALIKQRRDSERVSINFHPSFYLFNDRLILQTFGNASETQMKMDNKKLAIRLEQNIGGGIHIQQPGWGYALAQAKAFHAKDKPQEALENPALFTKRGKPKTYVLYSRNMRFGIFAWDLLQRAIYNNAPPTKQNRKSEMEMYATLGNSARIPSFDEAFGNGNTITGNSELLPEHSTTNSYGIEGHFMSSVLIRFNVAYFRTSVKDLILFTQNSPRTVRAINSSKALLTGYELEFDVAWSSYLLSKVSFTQLDAKEKSALSPFQDKYLPLRPRYAAEWYLESGTKNWRPFINLHWLGALYQDRQNSERKFLPARARYDIGLNYYFSEERTQRLAFIIKNILDEYHSDILGYPLPERNYEIQYYQEFE